MSADQQLRPLAALVLAAASLVSCITWGSPQSSAPPSTDHPLSTGIESSATTPLPDPQGSPSALSVPPTPPGDLFSSLLLAPGDYIAVSLFTGRADELGFPETEILLLDEAGVPAAPLVVGPGEDARLSADGRYLAYTERLPNSYTGLSTKLLPLDLCTGEAIPIGPSGLMYGYSWNNEGTQLAIGIFGEVYILPFPSGQPRELTDCRAMGEGTSCSHPEISPDGRYVAYSVSFGNPDGDPRTEIYVADTSCPPREEGCLASVSPVFGPPTHYAWSSDSSALAITHGGSIKVYEIPSGEPLAILPSSPNPTDTPILGLLWPIYGDGIIAIAQGGELRLIDPTTGAQEMIPIGLPPLGLVGAIRLSGKPATPCIK